MEQPTGLIGVLLDRSASTSERDDAAMDLADFDEAEVVDALLAVATDRDENAIVQDSVGTSLGEIWKRKGAEHPPELDQLAERAKVAAMDALSARIKSA